MKKLYQGKEVDFMPNILPVSDLRNYNEVLKNCQVGEPVFLTKNGRGKFVVMDIEDYEREKAEKKLFMKLQEAEEAVKDESAWMSLDLREFLASTTRRCNAGKFLIMVILLLSSLPQTALILAGLVPLRQDTQMGLQM